MLTGRLCLLLERRGLGAKRLDLLFDRIDGRIETIRVGTAWPVRNPEPLARLLTDRLETVDPGSGIEAMTLIASLAEPLTYRQDNPLGENTRTDLSALIDRLANRLGTSRLYRVIPVESDLPERSVRSVAPLAPPAGAIWPAHWPRPSRLLSPPEPIEIVALLPDHVPARFTWRGVRRRITRADGPERVFGEWWRQDGEANAVRDYFIVEDWRTLLAVPPRRRRGPGHRRSALVHPRRVRMTAPRGVDYVELQITTHFSFLRGASSVEELFAEAALLGIGALGVTDRHSLAGIVRAHEAAEVTGVRAVIGRRLDLTDGAAASSSDTLSG
jgi:hypothetical protein